MPATATRAKTNGRKRSAKRASPRASTKSPAKVKPKSILAELGAFGLDAVEPIILAALISRDPLLLIGPHGTGKSFLLTRICESLGLDWRHYNASLLNYDDLVGYPLPNENRELEFVKTPASIWGAQAVFLDEISRCRPDLQNKLFPIIHEKKVQGIPLEGLEYRWAAMNPPCKSDEEDEDEPEYHGSQPLDPALADRFAFVVTLPDWSDLTLQQQKDVLLRSTCAPANDTGYKLEHVRDVGKRLAESVHECHGEQISRYVCEVVSLLVRGAVPCSTRRGAMLFRNIPYVYAAMTFTCEEPTLCDAAYLTLVYSLTHIANGKNTASGKVLAVHREAWANAQLEELDPLLLIRREPDCLVRASMAVRQENLPSHVFSTIIADAVAAAPLGARHALAMTLFECGAVGRLTAAVAEQVAEVYMEVVSPQDVDVQVRTVSSPAGPRDRVRTIPCWDSITNLLSKLPEGIDTGHLTNLLVGLWKNEKLEESAVREVAGAWSRSRNALKREMRAWDRSQNK